MTTPIENFNRKECDLIPGIKVNAYTDLYLDPENPTGIILDTTWGESKVDLKSVVKAGETITRLYLAPETGEPEGLCYEKEDGTTDYIHGDELSRIISMTLLKDVDQEVKPTTGDVYMYNVNNLFSPYNLQAFIDATSTTLQRHAEAIEALQTQVASLQLQINNISGRLQTIENAIYNWGNDKTTKIARGNRNIYGDIGNTQSHEHGIFTHDPNVNMADDLYFS